MEMDLQSCKYLLLYFASDKTFDVRKASETNFDEEKLKALKKEDRVVSVNASYDGEMSKGIVFQAASCHGHIKPFEDECVFLKVNRGYSVERIMQQTYIPRFNVGKRPKFPARRILTSDEDPTTTDFTDNESHLYSKKTKTFEVENQENSVPLLPLTMNDSDGDLRMASTSFTSSTPLLSKRQSSLSCGPSVLQKNVSGTHVLETSVFSNASVELQDNMDESVYKQLFMPSTSTLNFMAGGMQKYKRDIEEKLQIQLCTTDGVVHLLLALQKQVSLLSEKMTAQTLEIKQLKLRIRNSEKQTIDDPIQPVQSVAEWVDMHQKLSSDVSFKNSLVSQLASCGGKTYRHAIRQMMDTILTEDMQCQINFSGVGLDFPGFKEVLLRVFQDALKKTRLDHQPTHHDIKIVIIEDLKHAKDRKTSRERRLKKKDTRKATTSRNIFDSDEDN